MGLANPSLIGRRSVIEEKIKKLGLRLTAGVDLENCGECKIIHPMKNIRNTTGRTY